jgi:hypothetical protein
MKITKITVALCAAMGTVAAMAAEPFVYVNDWPAGGLADQMMTATFPELRRNGFDPSIEYVKGCKSALDRVRKGQGHFTMNSGKYGLDSECGITVGEGTEFRIVSEVQSTPLMLCSTDNTISLDQLKSGKTFIGMTGPDHEIVDSLLASVGIDRSNYETVIYRGTNAALAAIKAGDIKMGVFGVAGPRLAAQGKCILSTGPNRSDVPRSNDINPDSNFVEYSSKFMLISVGTPSKEYVDLFTRVFESSEWQEYLAKTKFMHYGLGQSIPGTETEKLINAR